MFVRAQLDEVLSQIFDDGLNKKNYVSVKV